MNKLVSVTAVFGILLIAILPARAAPIYMTADFSGGVSTVTGLGNNLGLQVSSACAGCAAGSVGGHVLFDKNLIPAIGTGIVNIALVSAAGTSNNDIFSIVLGSKPLGFEVGDMNVTGSPSIQFKDGVFNGFSFVEDFFFDGKNYRFNMQGSAWNIYRLKIHSPSDLVASGYVTVGDAGLSDQATFFPPLPQLPATTVPEPATFALFGIGLLGIVMTRRGMGKWFINPSF
jgi:hypothetical protein